MRLPRLTSHRVGASHRSDCKSRQPPGRTPTIAALPLSTQGEIECGRSQVQKCIEDALAGAAVIGIIGALSAGSVAQKRLKVTLFIGPSPLYDSIQMADSQGFLKEGLDITFQLFPSGTTALQTFAPARAIWSRMATCPASITGSREQGLSRRSA